MEHSILPARTGSLQNKNTELDLLSTRWCTAYQSVTTMTTPCWNDACLDKLLNQKHSKFTKTKFQPLELLQNKHNRHQKISLTKLKINRRMKTTGTVKTSVKPPNSLMIAPCSLKVTTQDLERIYDVETKSEALFSSPRKPKSFQDSPSHRILWHMHETLNIDENKN